MTGDDPTDNLDCIQTADVILTTPEKWDSLTRRTRAHQECMVLCSQIVLLLVDEAHGIGADNRGAALESVIVRMRYITKRQLQHRNQHHKQQDHSPAQKFHSQNLRIIAASATLPNSSDIAEWLCARDLSFDDR